MRTPPRPWPCPPWTPLLLTLALAGPTIALAEAPIGQIKTETGVVWIERGGAHMDAHIGDRVYRSDVISTKARSSVGVTFVDNSLLALGPFSRLGLDVFRFDTTTHAGAFELSLRRGTLAVKSGEIVRQSPEAMRVRTRDAVLGVRGTEFVIQASGEGGQ